MDVEKELKAFSNGEYIFAETKQDNQFYFYRQDGQELGEVGRIPMEMYQNYLCIRMFEGKCTEMVANDIRFDISDDGKCIRLTTFAFGEQKPLKKHEEKGIKKLIKSLFNKNKEQQKND